jgi:hypothetical protein
MKKLLVSSLILCLVPFANAESIADQKCELIENIMEQTILSGRELRPIQAAENMWNKENDVRLRVFLKEVVREIYKNPQAGQQYLRSGKFKSDCVKNSPDRHRR